MALNPEMSVMAGLATATVVYGIYQAALPPVADVRTIPEFQPDLQATERVASWMAAAAVAGISLMTQDMTVFIIGGTMVIGMAWWHRHADMVIPQFSQAIPKFGGESEQVSEEGMAAGELYDYGQSEAA